MGKIKKCDTCNLYTLTSRCQACDEQTTDPGPPSFSFPDKYGEYRRETKQTDSKD